MNELNQSLLATRPGQGAADILAYLKGLWAELLHHPEVKPDDNFFTLGGDSVLVIEMLLTVSAHYDREFKHSNFFRQPTTRTLSELIEADLKVA